MLWHGTHSQNLLSIMNDGLKLFPHNASNQGSMFGNGIYFADTFNKAEAYSGGLDTHYVLLCEVALGRCLNTMIMADSKIKQNELQCDSV